jgi:hypothetical protein
MAADEQGQVLYGLGIGNGTALFATFRYPLGGGPGTLLDSAPDIDAAPPANNLVYDADGSRLLALAYANGNSSRCGPACVVQVALPSGAISIVAQIDPKICLGPISLSMAKGALVIGTCGAYGVISMSLATKQFTQLATFHSYSDVAAHPSSSTVYVRDFFSGDLYSLPLEGGANPLLVRSAWAPGGGYSMHFSVDGQYLYALANPEHPDDYHYSGSALARLDLHANESVSVGIAGAGFAPSNENAMDWQCNFPFDFAVVGTKVYLPCGSLRSSGDAFVVEFKCISFGG